MKQVVRAGEPVCARRPGGSRYFIFLLFFRFLFFFFLSKAGMSMNEKAFYKTWAIKDIL